MNARIAPEATTLLQCMQLMHQLFYFLDQSNYRDLASLFAPNGIWHRQGERLAGPAQIVQALLKRSATQRIRHLISNQFIESQSPDQVQMVAYLTAYRFDDGTLHAGPVEISRPFLLSLLRASLRQVDGAWRVSEMTLAREFEFVGQAKAGETSQ